jgi:hypothetical protein
MSLASPVRRRSCVGVQRDAWQDWIWILPGWMRFSPGLDLSPCFSPLVTKPLRTFSFSVYEVWVTAPPPAWSRQIRDRLRGDVVSPLADIHPPPRPGFMDIPEPKSQFTCTGRKRSLFVSLIRGP